MTVDSLIGAGNAGEDSALEAAAAVAGDSENLEGIDPFGDLKAYKNEENGLFFGRYKDVNDVFKSVNDMDKELGRLRREKSPEVPDDINAYVFTVDNPEGGDPLKFSPENDEVLKTFAPIFKEAKVTPEQAQPLFNAFVEWQKSQGPDLAAERQKLGSDAEVIIGAVENWMGRRGSDSAKKLAHLVGQDADLLKEFHILLQAGGEKSIPGTVAGGSMGRRADEYLAEAMEIKDKYGSQFGVRTDLQAKYENLMNLYAEAKTRS
jgi:hypothetical protein